MIKIFSDDLLTYIDEYKNDIIETLKDYDVKINDENITTEAQNCINNDFEYLKEILIHFDNMENKKIYCHAVLGLWYGKRAAFKTFDNLYNAVLFCLADCNDLYFKRNNTTLTLEASHHDGANVFNFYTIEKGKKRAITYDNLYNI